MLTEHTLAGLDLSDKIAVVTGASSGIGRAVALLLGSRGAAVTVNYANDSERAHQVAEQITAIGTKALAIKADVSDESDVRRLIETTEAHLGPVDILVNNAGIKTGAGAFSECEIATWDLHYRVNVRSAVLMSKAVLSGMVERGWGRIVNVSSRAARLGSAHDAIHYAASKAAMDALTLGLGLEYADTGVLVNAVAPGVIDTPMHTNVRSWFDSTVQAVPMRRAGTSEEIAEVIAFLASPANSYMLGEIVTVGGGR